LRAAERSPALSALAEEEGEANRGVLLVGRVADDDLEDEAAELIAAETLLTAVFDAERAAEAPVEMAFAALEVGYRKTINVAIRPRAPRVPKIPPATPAGVTLLVEAGALFGAG
jgi:hypothetical protein